MPSWTEVQGYLRSRYRLQTDEAQHFVIGFALEGGGGLTGPLIQGVQGQLIEVEQHALLLLRAEVGSDRALNPVAALLHSSKLVLGGLTLLGNHYVLRYTVPLQGLQGLEGLQGAQEPEGRRSGASGQGPLELEV